MQNEGDGSNERTEWTPDPAIAGPAVVFLQQPEAVLVPAASSSRACCPKGAPAVLRATPPRNPDDHGILQNFCILMRVSHALYPACHHSPPVRGRIRLKRAGVAMHGRPRWFLQPEGTGPGTGIGPGFQLSIVRLSEDPLHPLGARDTARLSKCRSGVQILDVQRVLLDEFAPRFDHIAHQLGEQILGLGDVLDPDLEHGACNGVQRSFP